MIAFVTGGDIAPYLLGAAGLIWGITAIVWIVRHPIRALIGFLLVGALIVFAFLKSVKITRMDTPESQSTTKTKQPTQQKIAGKAKPKAKQTRATVTGPAPAETDK